MADLEQTLGNILSDPEAISKIQELGRSLGLTGNSTDTEQSHNNSQAKASAPDLSALAGLVSSGASSAPSPLAGISSPEVMGTISRLLPLLNNMNQKDEATALLCALRPFLSEPRCRKLDEAEKILKIMRMLPFIRKAGLF